MNKDRKQGLVRTILPYAGRVLAALTLLLGALSLIGWAADPLLMDFVNAGLKPMSPASALCFLLLGTALLLRLRKDDARPASRARLALTLLVLLFSAAILLQHFLAALFGLSFDLEQVFGAAQRSGHGFVIGRMSPISAFLFLLLTLYLLFSPPLRSLQKWRMLTADVIGGTVFLLAGILAVGYWYEAPFFYAEGRHIWAVSLPSVLAFLLLASGFLVQDEKALFSRWLLSPSIFSRFTRWLVPGAAAIVLLFGRLHMALMERLTVNDHPLFLFFESLFTGTFIVLLVILTARRTQRAFEQAEHALRQSERRYAALVEASPAGIFRADGRGRTTYVSPRWCEISGMDADAALGDGWLQAVHPEDRKRLAAVWKQAAEAGKNSAAEYRFLRPDGSVRWVRGQALPERDAQGKVSGYIGVILDITEAKQAEEALRASEARYRGLFEDSPISLWEEDFSAVKERLEALRRQGVQDFDAYFEAHPEFVRECASLARICDVNRATLRLYRAASKEDLLKNLPIVFGDESYEQFRGQLLHIASGRAAFGWEGANYTLEGQRLDVRINWAAVPGHEGDLKRVLVSIVDMSERKRAEEALRAGEEKLRRIIEHSTNLFYTHTPDHVLTFVSPQSRHFLGCEPEEAMVRWTEFITDHPVNRQGLEATQRAIETGQRQPPYPLELRTKKGNLLWVEVNEAPVVQDGKVVAIVGSLTDITDRKRAEAEILRRVNELEVLYENGLAISRTLEPAKIGETIIEILRRRLDWHHIAIRLHNPRTNRMELLAFEQPNLAEAERPARSEEMRRRAGEPGKGLSGWVFQHKTSVLCPDVRKDPRYVSTHAGIRSGVYVPLLAGEEAIGSIAIESERERAFDEQDLRLLETIAAQAALALENARLYQDVVRAADRRAVLYRASQEITAAGLDRERIYRCVHEAAAQLMPLDLFTIVLAEEGRKTLRAVYLFDRNQRYPPFEVEWGAGLAGYVIRQKSSLRLADYHKEKPAKAVWFGAPGTPRSILAVPLWSGEKIVGVLSVQNYRAGVYTEEDEITLKTLAAYAGTAIENANLYQEALHAAERREVLHQLSQAISQKVGDAEAVYEAVYHAARQLMTVDNFTIALHDEARGEFEGVYLIDEGTRYPNLRASIQEGISGYVIRTGQALHIGDIAAEEAPAPVHFGSERPSRAWLCVPLRIGERIIGALSVQSYQPHVYTTEDERLLTTLAGYAAPAIENARLLAAERREREQTEKLRQALEAGAALSAMLDIRSVMDHLLESLEQFIPFDGANIMLVEPKNGQARLIRLRGYRYLGEEDRQRLLNIVFDIASTENLRWMYEHRRPRVIPDVQQFPGWVKLPEAALVRSWAGAPVVVEDRVEAFFSLDSTRPGTFTEDHARLLQAFAGQAALALRNARLFSETQRRLRFLSVLHTIDSAISASVDLRVTMSIILENLIRELNVDAAAVAVLNPRLQLLEFVAGRGFRSRLVEGMAIGLGEGPAGEAVLQRQIVSLTGMQEGKKRKGSCADLFEDEGFVSQYAVPLIARGQVQGVLQLCHRSLLEPDEEWLEFLHTLAGQTAIAIDNARLFDDIQRAHLDLLMAYDATIQGWSQALDLRDRETEGHTRRVADMTITLAGALGMSDIELEHVRRGALLHDIGKIGIPDSILHKPGPLTEEEWAIMRTHPLKAFEVLSAIPYLRPALDIPYCHHERWDGSGYPRGLKGEQIPLAARVFAVADVFDALTSDRPYRPAWSREKAIEYIKGQAGKHFDPRVVKVFLKMIREEDGKKGKKKGNGKAKPRRKNPGGGGRKRTNP